MSTKTFVSNAQSFTLSNKFVIANLSNAGVSAATPAVPSGSSNQYIDNVNNGGVNQINSIKTTNGTQFNIKELYYYVSTNATTGLPLASTGSVTFKGKLVGATVFTKTITAPPSTFNSEGTNYQVF